MAEIITQNLGTEDAFSPLIVGLNEAVSKLSKVLDFKVATLSDAKLTNVPTEDDFKNRIYESSNGNRLWLASPAPVIKKNGSVITTTADGFEIDYVGGAIYFSSAYALKDSDVVTVSCSYIIADSQTLETIRNELSKCVKTFCGGIAPDENGDLDPTRPMLVGSGASVEMKSEGDRIQSVTVHGFTKQAGSGDASPDNVREITVGGKKLVEVMFDGSSDENWGEYSNASSVNSFFIEVKGKRVQRDTSLCDAAENVTDDKGFASVTYPQNMVFCDHFQLERLYFTPPLKMNLSEWKIYISSNPLKIWYEPVDEAKATGIYTPIETNGNEYHCVCVPLTDYLCEGDTVETCVKSGCDKVIVFDGSDDEGWNIYTNSSSVSSFYVAISDKIVKEGSSLCDLAANVANHFGFASTTYPENLVFCDHNTLARLYFTPTSKLTIDEWKQYLSKNPLKVWYRSTEYTPENDVPVCLETHSQTVFTIDGNAGWAWNQNIAGAPWRGFIKASQLKASGGIVCSVAKKGITASTSNTIQVTAGNLLLNLGGHNGADDFENFKTYLNENPATVVAELATPITYAHDPVYIEAYPDGNGKFTVSGENTIDLYAKPFTDASTLDGKHADDFATADHVHNYAGSSSAGGAANTALACSGNAATATKLQTARTINGISFDGSANITTANWGAARTITIGKTAKSVNGGANVSWSLAEMGILDFVYPVGSIFEWASVSGSSGPSLTTIDAVEAYFGGRWETYGNGRVLVGRSKGETEFFDCGITGGSKTHVLTVSEMPSHGHAIAGSQDSGGVSGHGLTWNGNQSDFTGTAQTGGGQAHNNLQPYIVVFRYRRIA